MAVKIAGGGLAGSEAAWQLASRGIPVELFEMRPNLSTPAHSSGELAELVCSNSLGGGPTAASRLLQEELTCLGSLIMEAACAVRVPAGGALAVDRGLFARYVTERLERHPLITIRRDEVTEIFPTGIRIIATGPLTSDKLAAALETYAGGRLFFFDAIAPTMTVESIDQSRVFRASRYERGEADYLNCPMNKETYLAFQEALARAERHPLHSFEKAIYFEGCLPVEVLAERGVDTLRFGPLKPVGLTDPRTGERPYAVVQLRQETVSGLLYSLVGFQTNLRWSEQRRVFRLIPGLENAEFVRYGVMHRNTYLVSPRILHCTLESRRDPGLFFAGQLTGVEGYLESTAMGLLAGINAAARYRGAETVVLPATTMVGALASYLEKTDPGHFQPMNANFGLLPASDEGIRDKKRKKEQLIGRALRDLAEFLIATPVACPNPLC